MATGKPDNVDGDATVAAWPPHAERARFLLAAMRDWPRLTVGGADYSPVRSISTDNKPESLALTAYSLDAAALPLLFAADPIVGASVDAETPSSRTISIPLESSAGGAVGAEESPLHAASFKTSLLVQLFTRPCYSLVPSLTATLVTSVLRSLGDGAACDVRLWVLCAVQLAYAVCVARTRPSRVGLSNVLSAAMGFVTALGFALLGLEVSAGLTTTAASEVCTLVLSGIGGVASVRSICAFTLRFAVRLHETFRARRRARRRKRSETVAFYAGRFIDTDCDVRAAAAALGDDAAARANASEMNNDDAHEMQILILPTVVTSAFLTDALSDDLLSMPTQRYAHVELDDNGGDELDLLLSPVAVDDLMPDDASRHANDGSEEAEEAAPRFTHHELSPDETGPSAEVGTDSESDDMLTELFTNAAPAARRRKKSRGKRADAASLTTDAANMMNTRGDVASLRFQQYEYDDDEGAEDHWQAAADSEVLLFSEDLASAGCVNPLRLGASSEETPRDGEY
jgi:hypothetical protein